MKRLFYVVNTHHHLAIKTSTGVRYFDNKQEAKAVRDELNELNKTKRYVLARGPDHWKNNSEV